MRIFSLFFTLCCLLITSSCVKRLELNEHENFCHLYERKFTTLEDLVVFEKEEDEYTLQKIPKRGSTRAFIDKYNEDPDYWSFYEGDLSDSVILGGFLGIVKKNTPFEVVSIKKIDNPWTSITFQILIKFIDPRYGRYDIDASNFLLNPIGLAYSKNPVTAQFDPRYIQKIEK